MILRSVLRGLYKMIVDKSGSAQRIKYFRKQGMRIGSNCILETMSFSTEPYLIEIGDHVGVSNGTVFITHDGGIRCFKNDFPEADIFGRIVIGNNVFIGINCIILPNTTVGDNCIIGAGSVVRGKFPGNSIIIGNPAKVVMNMSMQKLFYRNNPGMIRTAALSDPAKKPIVMKHFGLV